MKINELNRTTGVEYKDNNQHAWIFNSQGELINSLNQKITDVYSLVELLELHFVGHMDWTQVAQDTPIFVRERECKGWQAMYFAFYDVENKRVYAYENGKTSWTSDEKTYSWKYATLA